jgi:hypothetical protein
MASTISDFFSAAPGTSQLYAPSEVQGANDFNSSVTTGSTTNIDSTTPLAYKDLDWRRLQGFEIPPPKSKRNRPQTSYIWAYGWRIYHRAEGVEY